MCDNKYNFYQVSWDHYLKCMEKSGKLRKKDFSFRVKTIRVERLIREMMARYGYDETMKRLELGR